MKFTEVIQQPGQKDMVFMDKLYKHLHVSTPGEIVSYDPDTRTATIQPAVRENGEREKPSLLVDVPVFFWGNFLFTPKPGDECLVVFADGCIDGWFQNGGVASAITERRHSLSDGFAFVGFSSLKKMEEGTDLESVLKPVSKESDGLCPQLPDETTTSKFLRQDGTWAEPDSGQSYTLPLAEDGTRGGVQIGYTASGKNYPVQLDNEKMYVNVPWENTTYSEATDSVFGLVKTGYTASGQNYPIQLSNGQMYVNVPWENTTYSAVDGIALSGTTFSNSGVRATSINGNYLRVNTNGTNSDLTIPYATVAGTLGTSTVGNSVRGIYLNNGAATALTWYPNYCTIDSGNKANYTWHRFAKLSTGTGQYQDFDTIIVLQHRYNAGRCGILKISVRTNATNASIDTSATWLVRYGYALTDVKITNTSNKTGTNTEISVYVNASTYARAVAFLLEGANKGWTLVSSNEPNDTTSTDKKGGTEIYASLSGVKDSVDGGTVNYANSAGSANAVAWANVSGKPSSYYTLPLAANGTRGGVQIGFTTDTTNKNYAVQLSSEKMYVNVPWTNTWRGIQNNLTSDSTTDSLSAAQGKALNTSKAAASEAIKNITRSGTTFTATRCNNTTFTFTQQDNNSWRGYQVKSYTYKYTCNANTYLNITASNFGVSAISGYTPVAVALFDTGNSGVVVIKADGTATSGTIFRVRNVTGSAVTETATLKILFLQT